ncbi:MAG: insulinase family protein, partial [Candidatus Omnitrophica bacterium]|nr:insulinase family protein [Candidatus Omnitrophota bacterium]
MFELSEINNKMRVVTIPMHGMNSVSIGVWVKAGARYEPNTIAGISHFIEHLVFKGTTTKGVKKIKEAIEGRGGMLNAFTSEEVTCYFV